jgi:hypothetical protein
VTLIQARTTQPYHEPNAAYILCFTTTTRACAGASGLSSQNLTQPPTLKVNTSFARHVPTLRFQDNHLLA